MPIIETPCRAAERQALTRRFTLWAILAALAAPALAAPCEPYVEEHPRAAWASFRPHATAFQHCPVSEETYVQVVSAWLRARPADAGPVSFLALGRAVDFPWISRHLADTALASRDWRSRITRSTAGEQNRFAVAALSQPFFRQRLARPFAGTGYALKAVSAEKVLRGPAREHATDPHPPALQVPFDAQIGLQLESRGLGGAD